MKKLIWCILRVIRDEKTNQDITALVYKAIYIIENCKDVRVSINYYNIKIETKKSVIEFWNANKYYAWLCSGSVNGKGFFGGMPSRSAMYDFKKCLKKHVYNIHQKLPELTINLSEISC
jgi:hypothetical protein